jgi:MFS family permease
VTVPSPADTVPPRSATPSLWRHRDFLLLWGGQAVSEVGSSVTVLALPLLAVITLRASAFEVGVLTACTRLAFLVVALPAGAWVDRWRKRPVLVWSDVGRVALLASIPLAELAGVLTLLQLYVVATLSGVLTVFFDVAYQSYVPSLVAAEQLVDANGKIGTTQAFGEVAGPGLGGALVSAIGAAYAVAADALSFLVSAVATLAIRHVDPPPATVERRKLRVEVGEGLRFVVRHPILKRVVGCTSTSNLGSSMFAAVAAVYLVRTLHAAPAIVGLVFSAGSVGGLLGGISAGRIAARVGSARVIWLSMVVSGPCSLLLVLAEPGWRVWLVAVSVFAGTLTGVVYNTAQVSYRQRVCPPELLGRMNASVRFLVWGTMPIGALIGGVLAELIGVRGAVLVSALVGWAACLWVVFSPLFGLRDVPG